MKTKICTKCKLEKSVKCFNKHKITLDGFSHWCKKCNFDNCKKWIKKNRKKYLDNSKRWYKLNKGKGQSLDKQGLNMLYL